MSEDNTDDNQENKQHENGQFTPEIQAQIQKIIEQRVNEKTEGLVRKRDELLQEAKQAKSQLRELKDKYGEDFSKFDKLLEEEQKRRESEMTLEERLTTRAEKEKKQLTDMFSQKEKEYQTILSKKDSALKKYLIESQLESEIAKQGGRSLFLKPALQSMLDVVENGDNYQVMVMDGDSPKLKLDGTPMGISDLVGQFKKDPNWAPAFDSSGASGGDATGNSSKRTNSSSHKRRSEMTALEKANAVDELGMDGYLSLPE